MSSPSSYSLYNKRITYIYPRQLTPTITVDDMSRVRDEYVESTSTHMGLFTLYGLTCTQDV